MKHAHMESIDDGLRRPLSGKQLEHMLKSLSRAIDIVLEAKDGESFPKKVKKSGKQCLVRGLKDYLCVGVNNVTRALEKSSASNPAGVTEGEPETKRLKTDHEADEMVNLGQSSNPQDLNVTQLQAVVVAMEVHPRVLVHHVALLCASRAVPLLPIIGGDGCGSLRLGELLGTRTAIAIGIKKGESAINWAIQSTLETQLK